MENSGNMIEAYLEPSHMENIVNIVGVYHEPSHTEKSGTVNQITSILSFYQNLIFVQSFSQFQYCELISDNY